VHEVEDVVDALEEHRDALEAVRDLARDRRQVDAADLLEVGELRDLHRIAPDLPAEAPGAEGRLLPVVLDEPDVVLAEVDSERGQRAEVLIEDVFGRRLENDLELKVVLEAERVLAVASVHRADHGLDVCRAPLLQARVEDAEKRGRVRRARSELGVVRLHDHGTVLGPVALQRRDQLLVVHAAKTTDPARRE